MHAPPPDARLAAFAVLLALAACNDSSSGVPGAGGCNDPATCSPADARPDVTPIPDEDPLGPREENVSCRLPDVPPPGDMGYEEVYPALDFTRPIWFGFAPDGSERRFVAEQGGRILVFDDRPDVATADVFLERAVSRAGNEEGLLGLAFHPQYAANGRFYIYYSASGPRRAVISEYRRDPQNPRRALPNERILLEFPQPYSNHNGGDLQFGPDGYLYIASGDGGAGGDPHGNGQSKRTLLAKILRIDVDAEDPACGTPYRIPADNPFAEAPCQGGDRREIWAYGLRNPWRMSFDRSTGELWTGDVGQDRFEEIDVIVRGGNYGWKPVEGNECFTNGCDPTSFLPPVFVYPHAEGNSVTGGYVYRGADLPELWGAYVFADYGSKRVWSLRRRPGAAPEVTLLANLGLRVTSFGETPDGELILVSFAEGESLVRLRRRAGAPLADPLPERLSQTGCFADVARGVPATGVVPFDVASPLWSDGAVKQRFFALPRDGVVGYRGDGPWDFPEGSILIKTFATPEGRRLETRLLRRGSLGWQGYTYRWNDAQDDAVLLPGAATAEVPWGTWDFPSRAQCDQCHTESSGFVLGPTTRQLNREATWNGKSYDQLAALDRAGWIDLPAAPADLPRARPPTDESAPLEARVRDLLDANCSICHRPGALGNAQIDLRASTPLAETGLCDEAPDQGDLGIADARLVAPGAPERSVLLQRMLRRGDGQMPPLASRVVDAQGTSLVEGWIRALATCP